MEVETPYFENAPVREVALSVSFEPLKELNVTHFGLLREKYREKYPRFQQHAPVDYRREDFLGAHQGPRLPLRFVESAPMPRVWFLTEDESQIIQFQRDLFVTNWRGVHAQTWYPRYNQLRQEFLTCWSTFLEFLDNEKVQRCRQPQWEITYVNEIMAEEKGVGLLGVSRILTGISGDYNDDFLSQAEEDAVVRARYLIPGENGTPVGRLRMDLTPGRRASGKYFQLRLTAKGNLAEGLEKLEDGLNLGHHWVVQGFASLTSPHIQREWRRSK
jgi:uncharacterized protein (TIGR04255 family)